MMISIQINTQQWDYLNQGDLHYILSYNGQQTFLKNKVVIIQKQDIKYGFSQIDDYKANQILQIQYEQFLKGLKIKDFLLEKFIIKIDQIKKQQFLQQIMIKIKDKKNKKRKDVKPNIKKNIFLGRNLFYFQSKIFKQSIFFQFKPKSPLYDQFSFSDIQFISQKMNTSIQKITSAINFPKTNIQKTRFYKKQLMPKQQNLSRNIIIPQKSFKGQGKNYLQDSLISLIYGQEQGKLVKISKDEFDNLINRIIKKQRLMDFVLCIHSIYYKPITLFKDIKLEKIVQIINKHENKNKQELKKILQEIEEKFMNFDYFRIVQKGGINQQRLKEQMYEQILRYLIAATWRDISLIFEVNIIQRSEQIIEQQNLKHIIINNKYEAYYRITILDYDLKPLSRLQSMPKKQLHNLYNYLKTKII